jgi:hypothetical protein
MAEIHAAGSLLVGEGVFMKGTMTDTTIANRTLVVESTGLVAGSITYQELEIKKGGSLQGGIYKVGREAPAMPARAPEPQRAIAPEPTPAPEPAAEPATAEASALPSEDSSVDASPAAAPAPANDQAKT